MVVPDGSHAHRVAREHRALIGRRVDVRAGSARHRDVAHACTGRVLEDVDAVGKHVFYRFAGGVLLHVHFGVRGTARRTAPARPVGADVALRFASDGVAWELLRPHRCELLTPDRLATLRTRLGPDPLDPDDGADEAWRRIHDASGPLAAALLDQAVVAGVGTEVAAESLHAARLHPLLPAREVRRDEFGVLWDEISARMGRAADADDILVDRAAEHRALGPSHVYRRKRCRRCGKPVHRARVRQRTAYFCPQCQAARGRSTV